MTGILDQLITRLTEAVGPDRALADEVLLACGWRIEEWKPNDCGDTKVWIEPNGTSHEDDERPNPLASIDAAVTLFQPDYYLAELGDCLGWWKARIAPVDPGPTMRMYRNYFVGFVDGGKPKTAAIALTLAALRARQSLTP